MTGATEPLISMAELAANLGVPLETVRRWRKYGQGPTGYRLGKRIQFRLSEIETWLQTQREAERPTVQALQNSRREA